MVIYDGFIGLVNCKMFEYCVICFIDVFLCVVFVVIVYFDFDNFKLVNDLEGYVVGDVVLMVIVCLFIVLICLGDLVVCIGGDEFVLLLECCEFEVVFGIVEKVCV